MHFFHIVSYLMTDRRIGLKMNVIWPAEILVLKSAVHTHSDFNCTGFFLVQGNDVSNR